MYRVKLDVFEGPLDLLLHLVKKNEVEISDVPTAPITEQYLSYIEMMQELHLDVAGEYLVMAATLLLIKSRTLLPAAEDEEEEEDPRAQLVQQLLEYQRYREAALELGERPLLNRDVFAREPLNTISPDEPEAQPPDEAPRLRVNTWDLLEAFRAVLQRRQETEPLHEVELERVSLRDRARVLLDTLRQRRSMEFERLFDDQTTRLEVVVTFLALLELMRLKVVLATQESGFGRILVQLRIDSDAPVSFDTLEEYETGEAMEGEGDEDGGGAGDARA